MRARIMAIVSMTVAFLMLAALTASAAPRPPKPWNLYQDKLGAYVCSTAVPKGQSLIAGPFGTQAACLATLATPPTIQHLLTPGAPDGANGWFADDVTLDWTVTDAPKVLVPMQLTGCVDQTITADQAATDYGCTATSVGGTAGPVTVSIKRDATPPVLDIGPGIDDADVFEVGSVPAEPTFEASDATSGIDTSSFTGYGTAVGVHTLIATATDMAGNVAQEAIGYTVSPHQAAVLAPTAYDEMVSGTPGVALPGSITIPSVEGVDYAINGLPYAPGVHAFFHGSYHVTAEAQAPDYVMDGYPADGWTLEIAAAPGFVDVTPAAPVAVDQEFVSPGVASQGGIDIVATTGVDYFVDGLPATGFVPLSPGSYLVTAQPWPFYTLSGQHAWTLEVVGIDPTVHVTAAAPSATSQTESASGFVTIPLSTGVDYKLDGNAVAAGNHDVAPGAHAVIATPQFGYVLDGVTSWNLTVKAWVPFTLTAGGFAYQYGLPAGYPALAAPVVDNVAHTITWTQPVNSAANPTYYSYFIGTVPNIPLGSFDVAPIELGDKNLANGELGVKATATLSPGLAGQESKFRLVYQSTSYNNPLSNVSNPPLLLPVSSFDLRGPSSYWDDAVGGHTNPYPGQFETGVAALWSGVTGTGTVTITLTFSSY